MGDQIPKQNRQTVQGRAFGRCERCLKATLCGHLHHRRPKGLGGSKAPDRHDVSNLVYLCPDDHSWAHNNPLDAIAAGYLVPRSSGLSPLMVPIKDMAGQTLFLDNEGQYLREPVEVGDV
jgi:5-methylcytosine-specific restriction protein A